MPRGSQELDNYLKNLTAKIITHTCSLFVRMHHIHCLINVQPMYVYIHTLHIVDTVKAEHVMNLQGQPYVLNGYFITFTKSVKHFSL